ncbi:MAG: hypothetical protein ACRDSL_18505 [Pseudonocardiaceae bacterium]
MSAPAVVLLTVTEAGGLAHLVTEDAMIVGRFHGRYVACCGTEILAGSLTEPERRYCQDCARWRTVR